MTDISKIAEELNNHYGEVSYTFPHREAAVSWLLKSIKLLFPQLPKGMHLDPHSLERQLTEHSNALSGHLKELGVADPFKVAEKYIETLPELKKALLLDLDAIYQGDPAAKSKEEVVLTYPGFIGIVIHRIAHFFYKNSVYLLPRIFSEYAHQITGIDIHPGATIGNSFCIDHGTGIVIGETTHIGERVKIYQGVTLGALSVKKELCDTKRHPTVEDDVVIYANTTILGGSTVIGKGSTIGGNVWLTESIAPGSKVYRKFELEVKTK